MDWIRKAGGTGFAVTVLAGALALAACGGGGGDDNEDDGGLGNVQTDVGGPTKVVETIEQVIEVTDNAFAPETVTIKAGTKVIWKWTGTSNPHSIQLSGNTSPEQSSGTYERVFDQTGNSFAYQCGVHKAAMAGRIVIE